MSRPAILPASPMGATWLPSLGKGPAPRMVLGGKQYPVYQLRRPYKERGHFMGIETVAEDEVDISMSGSARGNRFVQHCIITANLGANLSSDPRLCRRDLRKQSAPMAWRREVFHPVFTSPTAPSNGSLTTAPWLSRACLQTTSKGQLRGPACNTHYGSNPSSIPIKAIEQELERMGVKELSLRAVSDAVIHIRTNRLPDPQRIGNAGSFFKNPVISAGGNIRLHVTCPARLLLASMRPMSAACHPDFPRR